MEPNRMKARNADEPCRSFANRVSSKKRIARFLIHDCGLRKLHDSKLQKVFRSVLDEIDLQHLRDSEPCRSFANRLEMWRDVQKRFIIDAAIDYLEFGVFEGESIQWWTRLNTHKSSRFFGFDSFEGLPQGWHGKKGKGYFDVCGRLPQVEDPRIKFVKRWFENTLPIFIRDFSVKNVLVVHIDCDLYGGAMLALVHLAPFMTKGTILIFDEFFDRENEFKAFTDWQRIYRKNIRIVGEVENYAQICIQLQ
jgi:O-methyltransferase